MKYLTFKEPREYYLIDAGQTRQSIGTSLLFLSSLGCCPVTVKEATKKFANKMTREFILDDNLLEKAFEAARLKSHPVSGDGSEVSAAIMMLLDGLRGVAATKHTRKKIPYQKKI